MGWFDAYVTREPSNGEALLLALLSDALA